ncbi:MAG TPA: GGDEF domain-containing protein [Thermoanaerobaculia bacterium]|nr:GGDEF domain-containing protein [Thermoanaerobaculia bacterium]
MSIPILVGRVRLALAEVAHQNLPAVALFLGVMSLLWAAWLLLSDEPQLLVSAGLLAGALVYAGVAAALRWQRLPLRLAHVTVVALSLGSVGLGTLFLSEQTTFAAWSALLLMLPALSLVLLEPWAFAVVLALAAVVWSSVLVPTLAPEALEESRLLLVATALASGFVHLTRTRTLARMAHFRLRERARRTRLKEKFDSASRHQEQLAELSIRDPLTGAYNRRYLDQVQQELERPTATWGCIMIDLDHFKSVNDRFGHDEGDRVLQSFAHFLRRTGRAEDRLVRYGGDEFLLVIDVHSEAELHGVADRLVSLGAEESPAAFSIGRAFRRSRESLPDVIGRTDSDMYSQKVRMPRPAGDRESLDPGP